MPSTCPWPAAAASPIPDTRVDDNGDVVLTLHGGQIARMQPATGRELKELQRWDDFTLNVPVPYSGTVTPDIAARIMRLTAMSGRWRGPHTVK
jgi:hypothetical protein